MRKLLFLILLLIPFRLNALSTNTNFRISIYSTNISFMKKFPLIYEFPFGTKILSLNTTNFDFAKYSVDIAVSNISSNAVLLFVTPYEISNFIMPPLEVKTILSNSTNHFLTAPFNIKSQIFKGEVKQMAPLEDIFEMHDYWWILYSLLGIAVVVGIIFLIRWILSKRTKTDEEEEEWEDPYEEIIFRLEELKKLEIDKSNYKSYFSKVADVDRKFLGRVLNFIAPEMATTEIRVYLKDIDVGEEILEIITYLFKLCDRVKYAKHHPTKEQIAAALTESFQLVDKIKEKYYKEKENETSETTDEELSQ